VTSEPLIKVTDLVKQFGEQVVLNGVNLEVYSGETVVVMGGSGSGKSTLLRHMIGALQPDTGGVTLLGRDLLALDEDGLNEVRKKIGILFQSGALFNSMTVAENVALPLQEHTFNSMTVAENVALPLQEHTMLDQNIIEMMVKIKLELVGLREHADKYPAQISGGMKKRAGLARALSLDPQVLFYDEPWRVSTR
jgi:phospholipid/cholesterol/gamma-HCH transport system ATP-binding protein